MEDATGVQLGDWTQDTPQRADMFYTSDAQDLDMAEGLMTIPIPICWHVPMQMAGLRRCGWGLQDAHSLDAEASSKCIVAVGCVMRGGKMAGKVSVGRVMMVADNSSSALHALAPDSNSVVLD